MKLKLAGGLIHATFWLECTQLSAAISLRPPRPEKGGEHMNERCAHSKQTLQLYCMPLCLYSLCSLYMHNITGGNFKSYNFWKHIILQYISSTMVFFCLKEFKMPARGRCTALEIQGLQGHHRPSHSLPHPKAVPVGTKTDLQNIQREVDIRDRVSRLYYGRSDEPMRTAMFPHSMRSADLVSNSQAGPGR